MPAEIEEKVSFLEDTLNRFILNTDKMLYELIKDSQRFKEEMLVFKDEMSVFKGEMKDFKDEMKDFKDEVREFKNDSAKNRQARNLEMQEFKKEMREYKEEGRVDREAAKMERKEMNKRWGDLANKLGTFAEDIAAPNLPRIAKEYFREENIIYRAVRLDARDPEKPDVIHEFDAFLETGKKVFLLETEYTIRMKYIEKLPAIIEQFKACFPQFAEKELVPIFASMNIPENIVKKLTGMGIYAMAMGDETMDLLNFEQVQKRKK